LIFSVVIFYASHNYIVLLDLSDIIKLFIGVALFLFNLCPLAYENRVMIWKWIKDFLRIDSIRKDKGKNE